MKIDASNQPKLVQQVMISSMFADLKEHCQVLIELIRRNRFKDNVIENDYASPNVDLIESSLNMVRDSSAYVAILSLKYGQIPEDNVRNPNRLSLSELEFRMAITLNRPILLFIMGDDHPITKKDIESNEEKAKKLNDFIEYAKIKNTDTNVHRVYYVFNSLEDFKRKAGIAVNELHTFLENSNLNSLNISIHIQNTKEIDTRIKACDKNGGYELNLSSLKLKEVPNEIFNFINLEKLKLGGNNIKKIPNQIENLIHLKYLNVNGNQLNTLPETFYSLNELRKIQLRLNNITLIDEKIKQLIHLEFLDISRNKIQFIPETIGDLSNLIYLDFYKNHIKTIPTSVEKLNKLRFLDLSFNKLLEIPNSFGCLKNLSKLSIKGNNIIHIPYTIATLPKLQYFSYNEDNLSDESLFKHYGLAEIREILKNQDVKKAKFPLPNELRNAFQKYFSGFDEFFRDIKGKEIVFTVKKEDNGLEFEMVYNESVLEEDIQDAFQKFFMQLVKNEPLVHAYTEIEYNKIELARLEMKQEAEILGFKQQIRVLEIYNKELADEVRRLISERSQSKEKLLILEAENRLLLSHNKDLKEISSKPIEIHVHNNIQIINEFDRFLRLLHKKTLLTPALEQEANELKESINTSKSEKEIKKQSKSFFRKVLDLIKDTKTVTKDTEDTANWFVEKYNLLLEKIDDWPLDEIIRHFKQLIEHDITNFYN